MQPVPQQQAARPRGFRKSASFGVPVDRPLTTSGGGSWGVPEAPYEDGEGGIGRASIRWGRRGSTSLGAVWSALGGFGSISFGRKRSAGGEEGPSHASARPQGTEAGSGSDGGNGLVHVRSSANGRSRMDGHVAPSSGSNLHQSASTPHAQFEPARASQGKGSAPISFVVHGPSGTAILQRSVVRSMPARSNSVVTAAASAVGQEVEGHPVLSSEVTPSGVQPSSNSRGFLGRSLSLGQGFAARLTPDKYWGVGEDNLQLSSQSSQPEIPQAVDGTVHTAPSVVESANQPRGGRPGSGPVGEGVEGAHVEFGDPRPETVDSATIELTSALRGGSMSNAGAAVALAGGVLPQSGSDIQHEGRQVTGLLDCYAYILKQHPNNPFVSFVHSLCAFTMAMSLQQMI